MALVSDQLLSQLVQPHQARAVDAHDAVHDMVIAPRKKGDARGEQCGRFAA